MNHTIHRAMTITILTTQRQKITTQLSTHGTVVKFCWRKVLQYLHCSGISDYLSIFSNGALYLNFSNTLIFFHKKMHQLTCKDFLILKRMREECTGIRPWALPFCCALRMRKRIIRAPKFCRRSLRDSCHFV